MQVWRWKPLMVLLFWVALTITLMLGKPSWATLNYTPSEIRGVWITTNDTDIVIDRTKLHTAIDQLAQLNFNTIYPVVWNSGYALYPSGTARRAGIQPFVRRGLQDYDILAEMTSYAHRKGMLVLPWFEFGFMAPTTSELAMNHPQWLTQKRNGDPTWIGAAGEVVWLNPFMPEVQQLFTNLVLEVVSVYPVDGIQFDDHFSLPNEFGYDPYTLNLYKTETGLDAPDNPRDPQWVAWRAGKITAFVQRLHDALKARRSRAIFAVAPNPYDFAYSHSLQDWLTWLRQDLVDELVVQVYRDDLRVFREQISRPEIQEAKQKIPTGIGILTGLRNSPVPIDFIEAKAYSVRSQNLGIAFFSYESLWEESPEPTRERQASFQALFSSPIARSLPIAHNSTQPVTNP
jgi:uncharacterized lipoprotein YddW (UPF0748 family)